MEQLKINSFTLTGVSARTTNADEMDPKKAKIGNLGLFPTEQKPEKIFYW